MSQALHPPCLVDGWTTDIDLYCEPKILRDQIISFLTQPDGFLKFTGLLNPVAESAFNIVDTVLRRGVADAADRQVLIRSIVQLAKNTIQYPVVLTLYECSLKIPEGLASLGSPVIHASGRLSDIYHGTLRGQVVAVKAMKVYQSSDRKEIVEMMSDKITLWSHLRHPNIVPFYGVFPDSKLAPTRLCFVCGMMVNGNIKKFFQKRGDTIPPLARVKLVMDVACGLEYLHQHEIFHGNIKPENVLIDAHDKARLGDFGVQEMHCHDALTAVNAPETVRAWYAPSGSSALLESEDHKALEPMDVFAFAILSYKIIVNRWRQVSISFADEDSSFTTSEDSVSEKRPVIPTAMSFEGEASLWELVAKCWSDDILRRPNATAIVESLSRSLETMSPSTVSRASHVGSDTNENTSHEGESTKGVKRRLGEVGHDTADGGEKKKGLRTIAL